MPDSPTVDGTITRVQDLLQLIEDTKFGEKQKAHLRLWFRGQAKASWKLSPGVYRPTFPETNEANRLNIERHLTQDFRAQSAGLLSEGKEDAEIYFLQQHYRMPTRLLDWTQSPLAALHFAVAEDLDDDAALFMMDAYLLAPCQGAQDSFQGVATSRKSIFRKALRAIFDWANPDDHFPKFVLPIRPDYADRRVALQRACFTFHVPNRESLTKTENNSLHTFIIPGNSKTKLRKELFLLGIDAFGIYGDLESLSRRLRFAYKIS